MIFKTCMHGVLTYETTNTIPDEVIVIYSIPSI